MDLVKKNNTLKQLYFSGTCGIFFWKKVPSKYEMKEKFIDRICLEARPAEIDLAPHEYFEGIEP